jgi:hypothetical protein
VLTIAHDPFVRGTKYKVTIPAAAINELAADTSWVFTTVPPVGLAATSPFSPADGGEISTESYIWVNFNQTIDTVSLAGITINEIPVGGAASLYSNGGISNSRVRISTDLLNFSFEPGTLYTVVIPAGAIIGYNEAITWSFTGFQTLAAVAYTPASGATGTFLGTEISIEFNKANFNIQGYNPGEITITPAEGEPLSGVTYAKDAKKLVISHTTPLRPNTEYTVNVPNNVVATYGGVSDWTFTTEPASEITGFTPADGAVNVAVRNTVEVTFNKTIVLGNTDNIRINDVAPTSVSLQNSEGYTQNVLRLNHNAFTPGTEYTVTIPSGSVIGYDRDTSWTFTTVAPLVPTFSPADGATDVALNAPLTISFNRQPLASARPMGFITITGENGTEIEVINRTWNDAKDVLTIEHAPFDYNILYTVNIPAGLIVDQSDYASSLVWSFTTTDGTGLQEIKDASGVYPTLTKGDITVVSDPGSLIKIVDISGVAKTIYRSEGKLSPIHLDGANGLYLVIVENGKSTLTYKIVLQK